MLATLPHSYQGHGLPDISINDGHAHASLPDPGLVSEHSLCPGCKTSVVNDNGGVVVAFGQSFFHVDCFKCAKCGDQVTADTNLLLLSDGSPICANCSYSCNVCHQPILDEAIMTGDDSYHAHCFKCRVCKNRIDELVFAKTSQGIYCMNCHNERVARSRRHAQRKREAEKEKERAASASGSGSAKSRERLAREQLKENGTGSPSLSKSSSLMPSPDGLRTPQRSGTVRERPVASPLEREASRRGSLPLTETYTSPVKENPSSTYPSHSFSVTVAPPPSTSFAEESFHESLVGQVSSDSALSYYLDDQERGYSRTQAGQTIPTASVAASPAPSLGFLRSSGKERMESLPLPSIANGPSSLLQKRRSFVDSGIRPLDISIHPEPETIPRSSSPVTSLHPNGLSGGQGLSIPNKTSRADKRRSMNPGLGLSQFTANSVGPPSPTGSTHSITLPTPATRAETPPVRGRDSPRIPSPLGGYFPENVSAPPPFSNLQGINPTANYDASPPVSSNVNFSASLSSAPDPYAHLRRQDCSDAPTTRSRSASSCGVEQSHSRDMDGMRPPPRSTNTLDRPPPRGTSLANQESPMRGGLGLGEQGRMSPSLQVGSSHHTVRPQRSFDDRPRPRPKLNLENGKGRLSPASMMFDLDDRSGSRASDRTSRPTTPASPSHRVDVPHGVESETDTEAETEGESGDATTLGIDPRRESAPPVPPPKERKDKMSLPSRPQPLKLETTDLAPDSPPNAEEPATGGPSSPESSPVEWTSTATFIAPALPPIRFSMSGADFSDLLKSVGGLPSLKSDQLARVKEDGDTTLRTDAFTPPPSARAFGESFMAKTPTAPMFSEKYSSPTELNGRSESPSSPAAAATRDSASPSPAPVRQSLNEKADRHASTASWSSLNLPRRSISDSRTPEATESPDRSQDRQTLTPSSMGRPRSSSESGYYTQSVVSDSTEGVGHREPLTQITLTAPESLVAKPLRPDSEELVSKRLQEVLLDANERRASHIKLDKEFVEAILSVMNRRKDEHTEMKGKLDGIKRASQQYMDGLTVAHTEYDRECQARRDAEAEVSRLRVLLSGQAARLSAITSESKRQELQQQLSEELSHNLTGLEKDVSKLKVERDLTLAEVEALSASKRSPDLGTGSDVPVVNMSRTLSIRFDSLKTQYERELIPLTEQKEGLAREIAELKAFRDQFLEETTVLSARNEELAQLNRQYAHQIETSPGESPTAPTNEKKSASFDRPRPSISLPLTTSITNSSTFTDETADSRFVKIHKVDIPETPQSAYKPGKFIKWGMKASKEPTVQTIHAAESTKNKGRLEHVFQQLNILRFARCDHCGDKMWGSQFRCSGCHVAVHPRCVNHVQLSCSQRSSEDPGLGLSSLPPSMFGRELIEQVKSDWHDDEHMVPVIVEKCIEAVEARALDYEGIYRKTGGSGQSKTITQLFERGEYSTFDLLDQDRFNDICSVTSVLKTYLRQLPDPLLTYALHDEFVQASTIRDPEMKTSVLSELVRKLPTEHYYTLRMLMLHLNHVREQCDVNLMTARNLGVVFGPTLMRSQDSGAEFSDMGAKALSVEWLVENAPTIFNQQQAS